MSALDNYRCHRSLPLSEVDQWSVDFDTIVDAKEQEFRELFVRERVEENARPEIYFVPSKVIVSVLLASSAATAYDIVTKP
jgi:hypothetical protein